jgi:hypothetical protein
MSQPILIICIFLEFIIQGKVLLLSYYFYLGTILRRKKAYSTY